MPAKFSSIIRNYVLSVSSQRKYNFYHQNTLLDAFQTNSRNIFGRNPSMVIPLLANQDLTPMLVLVLFKVRIPVLILTFYLPTTKCTETHLITIYTEVRRKGEGALEIRA